MPSAPTSLNLASRAGLFFALKAGPHVAVVVAGAAALVGASGCGGLYYTANAFSAASRVEEARVLGAETLAPYEYYYAKEHLEQAQFEAAEASYSDAAHFADTAEEYATKAIEVARAARRAAP